MDMSSTDKMVDEGVAPEITAECITSFGRVLLCPILSMKDKARYENGRLTFGVLDRNYVICKLEDSERDLSDGLIFTRLLCSSKVAEDEVEDYVTRRLVSSRQLLEQELEKFADLSAKEMTTTLIGEYSALNDMLNVFHLLAMSGYYLTDDDCADFLESAAKYSRLKEKTQYDRLLDWILDTSLQIRNDLLSKNQVQFEHLAMSKDIRSVLEATLNDYTNVISQGATGNLSASLLAMTVELEDVRQNGFKSFERQWKRNSAQGVEMAHLLQRESYVFDEETNKIRLILCSPLKLLQEDDLYLMPVPRYAIAVAHFAYLGLEDELHMASGEVGDDGKTNMPTTDDWEDHTKSVRLDSAPKTENGSRAFYVAGPHITNSTLDRLVFRASSETLRRWEAAAEEVLHDETSTQVITAARRLLVIIRCIGDSDTKSKIIHPNVVMRVGGRELQYLSDTENPKELRKPKHADRDDFVRSLRGEIHTNWGATIREPCGSFFKCAVAQYWRGDIRGRRTTVKLDDEGRLDISEGLASRFESITGKLSLGYSGSGASISGQLVNPPRGNDLKTLKLINSNTPTAIVRMALASAEMTGIGGTDSAACYMPKRFIGQQEVQLRKYNHVASISSKVFSNIDCYYRKKDGDHVIFIPTTNRILKVTSATIGSCKYHVEEIEKFDRSDKQKCYSAELVLEEGKIGSRSGCRI